MSGRDSGNAAQFKAVFLVVTFILSLLSLMVPPSEAIEEAIVLGETTTVEYVSTVEQTYDLYLDAPNSEFGGQGSITTIEPNGGQEEGSAIDGLEFRSTEMISDLYINGTGSSNTARLSVYYQFSGTDGSTADMTFSLKSGDQQIDSENRQLENPCSTNPFSQNGCTWTVIEVEFETGSNGFVVEQGKQLKIRIDAQATCEGSTGGVGQTDCDVQVALERLEVPTVIPACKS